LNRSSVHERPVMTSPNTSPDVSSLLCLDTLYQRQMRQAAAEVAAAIAHAVGTPLNVIGGRAELIRQDPANALAQVQRIEEQVRKLADGLRQFVEYLTLEERASGDVPATQVLAELTGMLEPVALGHQVELLTDGAGLGDARIGPHALGNLVTLVSWAIRCAATLGAPGGKKVVLTGASASGGALFELNLLGLPASDGWRLDHFDARRPTETAEPYRMLAICAAIARGQGGKLQADNLADGSGVRIRLLCRAM
jgi:hypothetical protein